MTTDYPEWMLDPPTRNGHAHTVDEQPRETFDDCFSVADLLQEKLPEVEYVVPGIIPTGCVLVAGKPKSGKSYWALNVSHAVAIGGHAFGKIKVSQGGVLYLALEGTRRDLHRRFQALVGDGPVPQDLMLAKQWPTGARGVERLERYSALHNNLRLVVIDTVKNVRDYTAGGRGKNAYDIDYEALKPYTDLAERCGFSVIAIHHTNKTQNLDDPFDAISGSTGLRGAVDTEAILLREASSGGLRMLARGRQLEQIDLTFKFDTRLMTWALVSSTECIEKTDERQMIADVIRAASPECLSPKQVYAKLCGDGYERSESNVRHLLRKMVGEPDSLIVGDGSKGYGINPLIGGGCNVHSIHSVHLDDDARVNE